jgi:hypothetical protein
MDSIEELKKMDAGITSLTVSDEGIISLAHI